MEFFNISSFLAFFFIMESSALYFHMSEGSRKCFIEEVPGDTTVIMTYKVQLYDPESMSYSPSKIGVHIKAHDPEKKVILSRLYAFDGMVSFTSTSPGEHIICIQSNSTWFGSSLLRVHLDIKVGADAVDYSKLAEKNKLTDIQLRTRQLLEMVHQIDKEQAYQRHREQSFRQTSLSTNQTVVWCSLLQAGVLLGAGCLQLMRLRRFFQDKKLV